MKLKNNPSEKQLIKLRKNSSKYIPHGCYCHGKLTPTNDGVGLTGYLCPFWDKDLEQDEVMLSGYCHYMKRGDSDSIGPSTIVYVSKEETNLKVGDIINNCYNGLLWDQCKECGINE